MSANQHSLLLGAHMSIAGEMEKAIERGESIGCTAIQIFTKSNRQWHAKKITHEESAAFKHAASQSSIKKIIAHASYLINIGSPTQSVSKRSTQALIDEIARCKQLDIPLLVIHPGSSLEGDPQTCLEAIVRNLDEALDQTTGCHVSIALETMAGQGSSACHTFEQLAYIYQNSSFKHRLKICFDTCHAFAAGYDLRTKEAYHATWKRFDEILGIDLLGAIHLNDSKKPLGSRVDRHEDIGKGQLGLEAFELIMNDKRFFDIPKILETPKDSLADDERNMHTLKNLISLATKKLLHVQENV